MVQHVVVESREDWAARNRLFFKWVFIIITLIWGLSIIGSNLILGIILLLPFAIWLIRKIRKRKHHSHRPHHRHRRR